MESRLVIVGAGPIGSAAAHAALEDGAAASICAVVDPDPEARDALRAEFDAPGYPSVDHLPEGRPGDVAVAAFTSRADEVAGEINSLVGLHYHVVTTCEELAWPKRHIREALDGSARTGGRVIIAAGANPGFVMDRLPLAVATASRNITAISIERRVDTSTRRDQLVAKTGRGLTTEQFADGVTSGAIGHVGLEISAKLVAGGLGLPTHEVTESIEPVVDSDGVVSG
ncbi:MAG: Gfo/Idh/MocA family oxidoreductase, partial [Acidimicrobiia bacterium]|nr:Gfo/Idh/MocA family oxidoreductase [Acidimicrobiia bacterium]